MKRATASAAVDPRARLWSHASTRALDWRLTRRRQQAARTLDGPLVRQSHQNQSQHCPCELYKAGGGRSGGRAALARCRLSAPLSTSEPARHARARASAGATHGCPTCPAWSRLGGILGVSALASYEERLTDRLTSHRRAAPPCRVRTCATSAGRSARPAALRTARRARDPDALDR